jgi:hypothetical protein
VVTDVVVPDVVVVAAPGLLLLFELPQPVATSSDAVTKPVKTNARMCGAYVRPVKKSRDGSA